MRLDTPLLSCAKGMVMKSKLGVSNSRKCLSVCLIVEKKILLSLYKPKGDGI